jgi:hypothetical protein
MSIQIDLPAGELSAIKQITKLDDAAAAVVRAAREFLRLTALRELKSASGKVELDADWQQLEDLELGESTFPE